MVSLNVVVVDNNTQKITAASTITGPSTINFDTTSGTGAYRQVRIYAPSANTADVFIGFAKGGAAVPSASAAPYGMPIAAGEIEVFDMGPNDTITGITASASGQIVWCTLVEGAARN